MAKIAAAALLFGSLWLAVGARDAVAAEKKTAVVMCSAVGAGMSVIACSTSAGLTTTCPAPQAGNNCAQILADLMNADNLKISNVGVTGSSPVIYTLTR